MKIMILGDTGLIGQSLVNQLNGIHVLIGLSRTDRTMAYRHIAFDLEKENITPILNHHEPDLIISCSRGDFEAQLTCHKEIVEYAALHQIGVHFYSTANVFDASYERIWLEDDQTHAVSDYGKYKAAVEKMVLDLNKGVVIRLPMVVGYLSPRLKAVQAARSGQEKLSVYKGLEISLVMDSDVARLHQQLIEMKLSGVFHFTSNDTIDMYEFYNALVPETGLLVETMAHQYFAIGTNQDFILSTSKDVEMITKLLNNFLDNQEKPGYTE